MSSHSDSSTDTYSKLLHQHSLFLCFRLIRYRGTGTIIHLTLLDSIFFNSDSSFLNK